MRREIRQSDGLSSGIPSGMGGEFDLKKYNDEVENLSNHISALKKEATLVLSELKNIEKSRDEAKDKLKAELSVISRKTEETKKEQTDFQEKVDKETSILNEQLEKIKFKVKQEVKNLENEYNKYLEEHSKKLLLLNSELSKVKDLVSKSEDYFEKLKNDIDVKEQERLKLESRVQSLSLEFNRQNELVVNKVKEVELIQKNKIDLQKEVKDLEDIKNKKIKELNDYEEKEKKRISTEIKVTESNLEKAKKEYDEFLLKLEEVKKDYNETKTVIVNFANKKEEIERREKILKRKYEEAGFPYT